MGKTRACVGPRRDREIPALQPLTGAPGAPLSVPLAQQLLNTVMAAEIIFPLHSQAMPGIPEWLWKLWLGRTEQEAP